MPDQVLPTWGDSLGGGFDSLMQSIARGKQQGIQNRRQVYMDQLNRLQMTQQLGADPNQLIRGMNLQQRGFQPQQFNPNGQMMPQPSPSASQFNPGGPPVGPAQPLVPQMNVGGQGPANLPMNATQRPQDVADMGAWGEFQKFNQSILGHKQRMGAANLEHLQAETTRLGTESELDKARAKALSGGINPDTGQPMRSPKEQQYIDKRVQAFSDSLDPEKKRFGSFGTAAQKFQRAEALESLASAFPGGNLDSRQMEELAIGLNSMLTGSNTGAQQQVIGLIPKTIVGDANKMKEWLINNPTGTGQQAFVQRLLGTIQREKATAGDQIKREQLASTTGFSSLEKSSPQEFYDVLESRGISKEEYLAWKKGGRKRLSAVQTPESHPQDSQAVAWAKANPKDPRSKKILQLNGQ